ncbi:hypothetical protein [Sulfurimonas sp.]
MLFYFTIFLIFLYYKVARVYKKEENFTRLIYAQNMLVAISAFALYIYGFKHFNSYAIVGVSLFSFIVSALMITAIQLGIFVDGKPLFGISRLYKIMPLLALIIAVLSFRLWAI